MSSALRLRFPLPLGGGGSIVSRFYVALLIALGCVALVITTGHRARLTAKNARMLRYMPLVWAEMRRHRRSDGGAEASL